MKTSNLAVLLVVLCLQSAMAADFPSRMATMGNEDLDILESMNGRCNSEDAGETLDCTFTTVSVDHKLPVADIESNVEVFFARSERRGNLDEAVAGLFAADGLCSGAFLDQLDDTGRGLVDEYRQQLEEVCAQEQGEEAARRLLRLESEVQSRTCLVWFDSGDESLPRVVPGRWSLQGEPEGSCGVYNIVNLTCEENMYHCDYDERAEYTVTEGEFCEGYSGVVDEGDHYSWQVARVRELNCDFVQLWFE